ncbi:MAG TPA: GNAT family N-acetyltransferase [Ideonella sp.]|uniref:GNAT family N-acetyltransferase n=1 Tax=Ideonella sp. TaxID=1929293 RepID=UPI002E36B36D|nr:GNAT family N-acetyltransferase [Ideonella sp.]HEX5683486.1 GNAT family N-acetyltransferase [Ideonella sp.]
MTNTLDLTVHDEPWREAAAIVDEGLGTSNEQAAPLHEVQPLQCFVRTPEGQVVGGAVGRTWGRCVELQQLWVQPERRGEGLGTRLIRAFEQRAIERGCRLAYLETFSFQAPALYRSLGYEVVATIEGYGDGIAKYLMTHALKAP